MLRSPLWDHTMMHSGELWGVFRPLYFKGQEERTETDWEMVFSYEATHWVNLLDFDCDCVDLSQNNLVLVKKPGGKLRYSMSADRWRTSQSDWTSTIHFNTFVSSDEDFKTIVHRFIHLNFFLFHWSKVLLFELAPFSATSCSLTALTPHSNPFVSLHFCSSLFFGFTPAAESKPAY